MSRSCVCHKCRDMCKQRPCWPTPREAQRLIDAGFANRLMRDFWVDFEADGGEVSILAPAIKGHEGCDAPFWPVGQCTFQNEQDLCELHDLGLKPIEGRIAMHGKSSDPHVHERVALTWRCDTDSIIHEWQRQKDGSS